MSKFNLVLADSDVWYIDSLSRYIRSTYANKFNISIFTSKPILEGFLSNNSSKADILLASPDMLPEKIQDINAATTILLVDSTVPLQQSAFPGINKYQPGETIFNKIVEICSGTNSRIQEIFKGTRGAYVISVYSPVGGSGKTIISIYLSVLLSRMGLRVFYLNLESLGTTDFLMNSSDSHGSRDSFNDILFYLQENREKLAARINTLKRTDIQNNISFFNSSGCSLELDEITEYELEKLVTEMRQIDQFDTIVVDTDSVLNPRSMAMLYNSDSIVLVTLQNPLAQQKLHAFENEIKRIEPDSWQTIFQKIIPLVNMYNSNPAEKESYVAEQQVTCKIPCLTDIFTCDGNRYHINPNSSIEAYIRKAAIDILANMNFRLSREKHKYGN